MDLSFDPDSLSLPVGHFIGGNFRAASGVIPMHRPSDGKAFAECPIADASVVDQAVQAAKTALKQSNWGGVRPRERLNVLHRWADLIEEEAETLARLEAVASTRPVGQLVEGDIAISAEQIRFFAEFADKEGGDLVPTDDGNIGMIMTEPYGVVGAITPWNFPINMAAWKLGPALAAGNAVVLKPSEMTPFSSIYLAELAVRAGLPAGLINVVLGDGVTTGNAITGHPEIAKISFTGSTRAGSAIMENIARTGIKPMTLELGGKSPQIVFADADLDKAAAAITASIVGNAGQACVAGSRLIVEKNIAAALIDAIRKRMKGVAPGPTWDAASRYSPIISEKQRQRIDAIVSATIEAGAECLAGGTRMDAPGYFYSPTLMAGVDQNSPAIVEEIFGPVLTLQTFEHEEEALQLADHPSYGLAAGLFTRDLSRAIRLTRRLQAGTIWVNRYSRSRDHILPTGGYKQSGIGKDLGREAFQANRKSKSVLISL
ncbi:MULTISPECIES: aldehyde dehydrogenase family protein [unclassified Rhizobium]|uniref:aldehyde dehydrogenase family protein n=1 Tax=unclassified Rhizobium TaxID=2613769 RepID=UPI000DDEA04D|nr:MULTISPECIES: aldehyde dehydrogenase family protein [unclassified Rhizobium]MBB3286823.1 aldehyde dehydrogenase (NAD+) [Rhizobium sp. BK252]MBB3401563.1 aldehyde dehydrogenase (NAD+) [Rhizobium sp. BK289]MBB3414493.1 aldehyde dehydrogenase (NAD+) [Rhizobium sp. BK284]MBB3482381.1 aldehyde dehydrogenase (NAD+) [Rhizobium sp. BK347]MDK4718319.1 aldehyde dehydrogenase family protein [Rhizobium sp. CNPSo 3968]